MIAHQVSVFIENKKGHLAAVTKVLFEGGVDIRAISLFDTKEFGVLRLIVDHPEEAASLLKETGHIVNISSVFAIDVEDQPGGLYRVLEVLDEHDISIEYTYSFYLKKEMNPLILFKVDQPEKATQLLCDKGISVVGKDRIHD